MKALSNLPSGQFMSSNKGQFVRSCLPILGTGLLVILVSGGFPPTTWVLLFKTFSQLNHLLVSQGPGVILVLIVLIVQSLLLAVAWGLLGWVVMLEGRHLMTIQSKAELDRLLAFQSSNGDLIPPSPMLTKQLPAESDYGVTTDQLEEEPDYTVATDQLEEEADYAVTTGPLRRGKDFLVTTGPLDVTTAPLREEEPEGKAWASRSVQPGNVQSSRIQSRSVQSGNVQSSRVQSHSVQSSSIQSRNVQSSSVQSRRTSRLRQGSSRARQQEEDLLENPFDREVPLGSETTFDGKRDRVKVVVGEEEQPDEENEEEDAFVFGNPFDGPLPEVFRYDTELRRSVMELREEEDSGSNGSKAKGSASQKTRRFSENEDFESNGSKAKGSASQKTRRL